MSTQEATRGADALAERLFSSALGAYELLTIHLGDRLGLYRALEEAGAATPPELAQATGLDERYVREWLEQQAVAGLIAVERGDGSAARRYRMPPGHRDVLLDRESLAYLVPMARFGVAFAQALPAVEEAMRTGGGVPWDTFGELGRTAQGDANRPLFLTVLGSEWLPAIQDVHARLQADPPARVADVACGVGWSSIGIARGYPAVRVDGFDLDAPSIEDARQNAADAGVADRVTFQVRDAAEALHGSYQLVIVFEAIHDLSRPVEVLRTMRRLVAADGAVIVVDEKVADEFEAPGDEVERLMYTYSVLCCLPVGMSEQPSAATGTVMRADTLRAYAAEAGFRDVEVLPIEHEVFRLYRLHP
jgi:2-polyprenyl-3-methyl-5-hydroxy-6-metoxy-1,4-benzoquinol methylase